jgi:hypothetical protein
MALELKCAEHLDQLAGEGAGIEMKAQAGYLHADGGCTGVDMLGGY